jgi:alpha-1,3-mannosyltransferase
MKVLHLCTDFHPAIGGIEKFVLDLARHGRAAGIEPSILCLNRIHGSNARLPARDAVDDIPIRRIPFVNLKYYKPAWLPLRELKRADLLHVHGIGANLDFVALTRWLHRKPILLSTHGGIFHTASFSGLKKVHFSTLHRLCQRALDRCIACSRHDLALFAPVARNLVLIENGVDLTHLRACADGPKIKNRLLYVGRISRNKRIDLLLRALAGVKKAGVPFELHLVGPDWDNLTAPLAALARTLGLEENLLWTGPVSDARLREEFAAASYFLSASAYEGFGLSAVEAMAAGCVPLLSDIPAFRNLITPGQTGLLIDYTAPAAPRQIADALSRDPQPLRAAARRAAEAYAWEAKIPQWRQLYDQVLHPSAHPA